MFLSELPAAHTGTWKPSLLLGNPTDGCLAFLSINNQICCRETTVAILWNLLPIMVLHNPSRRGNKKLPKPFHTLYREEILTVIWLLHSLNVRRLLHFYYYYYYFLTSKPSQLLCQLFVYFKLNIFYIHNYKNTCRQMYSTTS